jgi:hypothetical protein
MRTGTFRPGGSLTSGAVCMASCILAACFGSSSGSSTDGGGAPMEAETPADTGGAAESGASVDTGAPVDAAVGPDGDAGCVPGVGLQNGDFSQGLQCWSTVVVSGSGSAAIGTSTYYQPTDANCDPPQNGHPFLSLNVYRADVYVSQTFTVPAGAQNLSWVEWNSLDPTTAKVSVVASGTETVLDSEIPPSLQALSNPSDYYSVVCSGHTPTSVTKPIAQFAGQEVELRLRGTYVSGVNGLFTGYTSVVLN